MHRDANAFGDDQADIDVELLERLGAGDKKAAGELYDRHSSLLYGLVLRILGDRALAEEVLVQVFVDLWARRDIYDAASGRPVAWLVRIARIRALNRLRSGAVLTRAPESVAVDGHTDEQQALDDRAGDITLGQAARKALAALPTLQRELIEDAFFLGLTHAELACRRGLPVDIIRTQFRTGMQLLRQSLMSGHSDS